MTADTIQTLIPTVIKVMAMAVKGATAGMIIIDKVTDNIMVPKY